MPSTPAGTRSIDRGGRSSVAVTDDEGRALFTRVPTGGRFVASIRDAQRFPLLAPAVLSETDLNAVLEDGSGAAIRLHLVWGDGRPGAGIGFAVRCAEKRFQHIGTTDEDGELRAQGLAPGAYAVRLEVGGGVELELQAGEEHEGDLVLGG
jgi:hypothetical protein